MWDVTGLFVVLGSFLMGAAGDIEPISGYCIRNQCFTLFGDLTDFESAKIRCENRGGHLISLRSSVSNDVLSILLGNLTGRFWIGLHLASGCPDLTAELNGFQWVTGDSDSDFANWATSFDSNCSSLRCVSVSGDDDFKWTQEQCDTLAAGFLCEHSLQQTCEGLDVAQGESVKYTTSMGFGGEGLLSLPVGSIATRLPNETTYICYSGQWQQAPWSCEVQEGGCEYKCATDPNNQPSCYCPPGRTINPANNVTCEDAEGPCVSLRCEQGCYLKGDSYVCMCDHGFRLAPDGRSCLDVNECSDDRQCPMDNFKCVNTVDGFECVCKDGYKKSGDQCVDVNECVSAPCEHMCTNIPGNYKCSCYDGYRADPKEPFKCQQYCEEVECPAECDPNEPTLCYCPRGYILDERPNGRVCLDIDECSSYSCDQDCENTFGGYVCACNPGFTLVDGYKCKKTGDGTDTDGGPEGSGAATIPSILTASPVPHPDPTRQPSGITVGGLVGIIVCTVFLIVLVVFLVHHFLSGRGKMESAGALKAPDEAHGLHRVTSDA